RSGTTKSTGKSSSNIEAICSYVEWNSKVMFPETIGKTLTIKADIVTCKKYQEELLGIVLYVREKT
ncbi:hypothetical protein QYM36_001179, partial [Artemia franciscana]